MDTMPKKTRREFLKTVGQSSAVLALSGGTAFLNCAGRNGKKPNIVLIFMDDMGYADVGSYGAKDYETIHLDRMAHEGMRFTDFYASQAVCSASRASLLTGCYAERVSILGALGPYAEKGIHSGEVTIADLLKRRGYATAMFGKWHLGHHKEFLPVHHGFDEYFGLPYSNDMWPVDYDGTPATHGSKTYYPPLPLIEGDKKIGEIRTLQDQNGLTTRYTERAVRFIQRNRKRPFFLYLAHSMVHVPLGVSEKFRGKSGQGMFGDVMMEVDWSVGQVLQTLDKEGLSEDTLVIFTSDNGPWLNFGNHAGSALPLREGKGTMFEGGPRVPCIMRWPGHIPAGTACPQIAATIDILPTLAAITSASLPENPIDGVNIHTLLQGDFTSRPRDHFFFYYDGELRAVRKGSWKLYFPHRTRSYEGVKPGRDGYPGPYASLLVGHELYNLERDIGEKQNVYPDHPGIVAELESLAEECRRELGDRLTGQRGKGVREPGRRAWNRSEALKHLAVDRQVVLARPPSPKYPGQGAKTLVDGKRGSRDYSDGRWLGFEGEDLDAVIDLGKVRSIRNVTCGFLRNQGSWIFLPESVEIALSENNADFQTIHYWEEKKAADSAPLVKDYSADIEPRSARYIRIKAKNRGKCPPWHIGAGNKAWIFADEIIVR
jgi:arylsulfatase A-like enzyme